jgi:hypothetical protein
MCFDLVWFENFLIWLVVVCAIVAIFRLVLPTILSWLGVAGGLVMQVLNIILIAFVVIALIYLVFDLLSCAGGLHGLRR